MTDYKLLSSSLKSLLEGEDKLITLLSNTSALFNQFLEDINWVGYYLNENDSLILGPFQGKVACEKIPFTKGVCGKCATDKKTVLVKDVHQFPGHIACDSASNSEIVLPIMIDGKLFGLLDIDSPTVGRFDENDQQGLQQCVTLLQEAIAKIYIPMTF